MKDWIMELCPEIQEWQAEIIAEHTQKLVDAEREACAQVCEQMPELEHGWKITLPSDYAAAIRARGEL